MRGSVYKLEALLLSFFFYLMLDGGLQRPIPAGLHHGAAVPSFPPYSSRLDDEYGIDSNTFHRDKHQATIWFNFLQKYLSLRNNHSHSFTKRCSIGRFMPSHKSDDESDDFDDDIESDENSVQNDFHMPISAMNAESDENSVQNDFYMPISAMNAVHWEVIASNSWIWPYPLLVPDDVRGRARYLAQHYKGKYCWSICFDPYFVASLMAEGFLPMAEEAERGPLRYLLVPKLHHQRCVLRFADLHISRTVRKRSKRFDVTCDTCFERVVEGCLRQHGESWLLPPIVEAFRRIHLSGGIAGVRVHSFEVWIAEGLSGGRPPSPAGGGPSNRHARVQRGAGAAQ